MKYILGKLAVVLLILFSLNGCVHTIPTVTLEQKLRIVKILTDTEIHARLAIPNLPEEDKTIFRQEMISRNPEWTEEMKTLVKEGKIRIGMTKEQVLASWGKPYNKATFGSVWGTTEQWTYGTCLYGCTILDFDNQGKLTNYYQSQ